MRTKGKSTTKREPKKMETKMALRARRLTASLSWTDGLRSYLTTNSGLRILRLAERDG